MTTRLTDHAVRRAAERHGWSVREATNLLRRAAREGVLIPDRLRGRLTGRTFIGDASHRGIRLRVWGQVCVIVRGGLVITTFRLTIEQLADLIVWMAIGIWPGCDA